MSNKKGIPTKIVLLITMALICWLLVCGSSMCSIDLQTKD